MEINCILTISRRGPDPLTTTKHFFSPGLLLALALAGCSSPVAQTLPTPSANVPRQEAWHDAELLATREPGREVLVGAGDSMAPVYGDGTVLVVRPVSFDQLRAGMTVVYLDSEGRRIAHRLVSREEHGWQARGLNNTDPDPELVTAQNLIGEVYASLAHEPQGGEARPAK
jgi:hypothetical protein